MIARPLAALALLSAPCAALSQEIQPQSGTWAGEVIFDSQTGCPAQMVAQMQQARQGYTGQQITFPDPFGPQVFKDLDPDFTWTKLGPNMWEGIYRDVQQTAVGTLTVVSKSILVIIAPGQINQIADLSVDLPPNMAQSMGMTGTTCLLRSNVYHKRTGP